MLKGCKSQGSSADLRVPITIQLLQKLCNCTWAVTANKYEALLFKAMFAVAFFGLCRVSEIAITQDSPRHTVLLHNVCPTQSGFVITLLSAKNNQNGPPQYINLYPNQVVCPVLALQEYLNVRKSDSQQLFVHFGGQPVTDSNFRGVLQKCLQFLRVPSFNVKSHSFRIGGATYLHMLGYSDEVVRSAGRWGKNSTCYKKYIR